jgi:hypothetical protein
MSGTELSSPCIGFPIHPDPIKRKTAMLTW